MKIIVGGDKIEGIFQKRLNRFIADVLIGGKIEKVHVANTGRMKELLVPGAKVILQKAVGSERKTKYSLLMVYKGSTLVCIDSKLPNALLQRAFTNKKIPCFEEYNEVKREVTFGNSKFDFCLKNLESTAFVEAKCVTLVKGSHLASFPDAPTERGRKHVLELIEAREKGIRGAVFFIIQRNDAKKFTPNREMDDQFYNAVVKAANKGVEFYAYNCNVTIDTIELRDEIEVIL